MLKFMNTIKYKIAVGAISLLTIAVPLSAVHAATTASTPVTTTAHVGLTTAQKNAIINLIKSFGADAATIAKVTAALNKSN
jgi:hypothetical protein